MANLNGTTNHKISITQQIYEHSIDENNQNSVNDIEQFQLKNIPLFSDISSQAFTLQQKAYEKAITAFDPALA